MLKILQKSLEKRIKKYLYDTLNFKDYKVKAHDNSLIYLGHLANPDLGISLLIIPISFNKVEIEFHNFYKNWNDEGLKFTFNNLKDFKSYLKESENHYVSYNH